MGHGLAFPCIPGVATGQVYDCGGDPEVCLRYCIYDYYRLCGALPCVYSTPYSLGMKVKVTCHTPSDSKFSLGRSKPRMSRAMIRRLAIYWCVAPLGAALQSSSLWQRLIIFAALPSWVDALILLYLGRSISRQNDTKEVDSTGAVHAILQGRTVDFSGPIPLSVDDFGPPPAVVLGNPPQSLTLKASCKSAAIRIRTI